MSTTPVSKSKFSNKSLKLKTENKTQSDAPPPPSVNTPVNKKFSAEGENDYSPVYFPLTQESNEDIDVIWDWHSPQSSNKRRKKQKRLIPVQSPKFPLKRLPSNNQSQNFEKLRNELKALQEELAVPDDESCLCVSPQQEIEVKRGDGNNHSPENDLRICNDIEDFFNDSIDEQLVLFSQKEDEVLKQGEDKESHFSTTICDKSEINNLIDKYSEDINANGKNANTTNFFDDTFNFEKETAPPQHSKLLLHRTLSENAVPKPIENFIQTASGKLEFYRTKSFELANPNGQGLTQSTIEDIERKRLEAKAKLEIRKKKENAIKSPIRCLPEEIEKKRLQALAKREAKKLQDIVEKKRQEALKKLQINRMKNASQVKSTLTKRL